MRILDCNTLVMQSILRGTRLNYGPGRYNYASAHVANFVAQHHQDADKQGHRWHVGIEEDNTFAVIEERGL